MIKTGVIWRIRLLDAAQRLIGASVKLHISDSASYQIQFIATPQEMANLKQLLGTSCQFIPSIHSSGSGILVNR